MKKKRETVIRRREERGGKKKKKGEKRELRCREMGDTQVQFTGVTYRSIRGCNRHFQPYLRLLIVFMALL